MKIKVYLAERKNKVGVQSSHFQSGESRNTFKNHGLRVVSKKWFEVNYLHIIESFKVTTGRPKNNYLRKWVD